MTQESPRVKNVFRSVVRAAILVLGTSSVLSVHAKQYRPRCVSQPSYTSLKGRGLYIQGGEHLTDRNTNQTFMIDLTESWDVNNPKYKQLPAGVNTNYVPGGITSDGELWTVMDDFMTMRYNATSKSWVGLYQLNSPGMTGMTGATDPTTDMMYIPFGYYNAKGERETFRLNLRTGETTSDRRPYPMMRKYEYEYATTWNPLRKSVVFVGFDGVFEYTWEKGWKPFISNGLETVPFKGSCLVSVSGGTKMALFGGRTRDEKATLGDIYVLDLTKKGEESWTKALIDPKQASEIARHTPACGSTGDQVIISDGNALPDYVEFQCPKQRTLVFNVKTMQWTNRYVAPGKK
ncbi:MAG: hypothetical protein J3Q66DRAFT_373137 [Benniella sp.]|nr:MAG: hypothetical protein J3Q66DRAFT_373137 [Benniella sp.]